jgi:hypothetical protein
MPKPPNDPPPQLESAPEPILDPTREPQRPADPTRKPPRTGTMRISVRYERATPEQHQQVIAILSEMLQAAQARLQRQKAAECQDKAA